MAEHSMVGGAPAKLIIKANVDRGGAIMGVLKHLFSREYPRHEDEYGPKYRRIRRGKSKIFLVDYVDMGVSHINESEVHGSVRKLDRGLGSYRATLRVS